MKYEDIPQVLVHAVVSAEDKRFFQHSGFDPVRIIKSAYVDREDSGRTRKARPRSACSWRGMLLAGQPQ